MRDAVLAIIGGAVLTTVIAVCALLVTMATAGSEVGRREALFGALFFEALTDASGATIVTVGLDDPLPLVLTMLVVTCVLLLSICFFHLLRARQLTLRTGGLRADDVE